MPRLFFALAVLLVATGSARAQTATIPADDQVVVAQIEAQLTAQGLAPDIDAATAEQVGIAAAGLVNESRGPVELANLMRVAVSARPDAVEAILADATGAAAEQGFSSQTIGGMVAAAMTALRAQGVAFDRQRLLEIVAAATGMSFDAVGTAVSDAGESEEFFENDINQENPNQDASPD